MLRGLTIGLVDWTMLIHVGYLMVFAAIGMFVARRRLASTLVK